MGASPSLRTRVRTVVFLVLGVALAASLPGKAHFLDLPQATVLRLGPSGLGAEVYFRAPPGKEVLVLLKAHDRDGDGTLNEEEARNFLKSIGKTILPPEVFWDGVLLRFSPPLLPPLPSGRKLASVQGAALAFTFMCPFTPFPGEHALEVRPPSRDPPGLLPLLLRVDPGATRGSFPSRFGLTPQSFAQGTVHLGGSSSRSP